MRKGFDSTIRVQQSFYRRSEIGKPEIYEIGGTKTRRRGSYALQGQEAA
jgi:hypothetical protein